LRAGGLHLPVHRWVVHESRCGLPARRLGVVAAGHYTQWCITVAALQVAGSQVADGCGARAAAQRLANNYGTFVSAVPKLLNVVDFAHRVVGPKPLEYMSGAAPDLRDFGRRARATRRRACCRSTRCLTWARWAPSRPATAGWPRPPRRRPAAPPPRRGRPATPRTLRPPPTPSPRRPSCTATAPSWRPTWTSRPSPAWSPAPMQTLARPRALARSRPRSGRAAAAAAAAAAATAAE